MLKWQEAYATGIADIDEQHKKIFSMINELDHAIAAGDTRAHLEKTIQFLGHYAKIHFNFEEICMAKYRCPVAAKNKNAHQEFKESYLKYADRFRKEGYSDQLLHEIHKMCEDWIVHHICQVDVHLRECVHKKADPEPSPQKGNGS